MKNNGNIKRYLQLNNKYINDADKYIMKDDYVQASEKLWGASVTIIKAIAAQRGKTIKSHEGIQYFFAQIAKELKDANINTICLIAEGLHQNFYENTTHPDTIKKGSKTIKQFVIRMRNKFAFDDLQENG